MALARHDLLMAARISIRQGKIIDKGRRWGRLLQDKADANLIFHDPNGEGEEEEEEEKGITMHLHCNLYFMTYFHSHMANM